MKQSIPCNGTEPLKVGDKVKIVPEWKDPGDEEFERFVIEAPEDRAHVRIQTMILGLLFHPTEWIETDKLLLVTNLRDHLHTSHQADTQK